MNKLFKTIGFLVLTMTVLLLTTLACKQGNKEVPTEVTHKQLVKMIAEIKGDVAVAFINLDDEKDNILINAEEEFHAASTMKVPVMIELFQQQALQTLDLQDSIVLKNEFKSIVDGSSYQMDIGEDSDDVIYKSIGKKVKLYDLMYSMITMSSNLATNVLIELVDAKQVTQRMRDLGAMDINVLRGVEDMKAFELGLSNSTTAKDLMIIMKAIAENKAGSDEHCKEMVAILTDQNFKSILPKLLPKDVKVAHKTGSITGVHHDAGIVYLPDGRSYVLVLLSKNLEDFNKGTEQLAALSKRVYEHMNQTN